MNQPESMTPEQLLENPEGFVAFPNPGISVRYGNTYRIDVAREQAQMAPPSKERVAELANEALSALGIKPVENPVVAVNAADIAENGVLALDYDALAEEYQLADRRDIVNVRFDAEGYPVLVAVSDDVNFCPPPASSDEYPDKEKCTTAAIILRELGTDWDYREFLLFPLTGLSETDYTRHDAEMIIGNYLLANGVALLDKYSHCY